MTSFQPISPTVRLVQRDTTPPEHQWDHPLPATGRWRVTGPAGSGVSSFVVDTVVAKIRSGANPDGIVVVAASKEAAGRIRREIMARLTTEEAGYVASYPLVRSVHSLAFALLRTTQDEQIRMISGADHDAVIQDLLAGHAEDNRGAWPDEIRPALTFVGFARQLRDVLLRSAERGLTGADLAALGRHHNRPLWVGAGEFQTEYDQIMSLADSRQYSASELVAAAAASSASLPHRWHTVVVDDAQHLDPTSGELINRIVPHSSQSLVLIGGDPAQSIFRFRGATSDFFEDFQPDPGHDIVLGPTRRTPNRRVVVVDSDSNQRELVTDAIRRAHLLEGVAWSEMAVVVRSAGQIGAIRRALLAAGVPVHIDPTDVVLAEQHIVASILLGIKALTEELSHSELENLILGPVGGADPVTLRRLVRGLRRFDPSTKGMDTLAELLRPGAEVPDFADVLTEREMSILNRLREVLEAGRASRNNNDTVEEILWAVWEATGLSDRLMAAALRGGATGSQADRDLDSMMALFDAAGDFAERFPTSGIDSFVRYIKDQELPTGVRDRRAAVPEAVSLVTAHGVAGHQYRRVVVAGVQEGQWPSFGETGSLFSQEDLIDLLDDGIDPDTPVSHTAERLAEEKRLFHVATTRATEHLLVTAVHNMDSNEPVEQSRFLEEFAEQHGLDVENYAPIDSGDQEYEEVPVRLLSPASIVAELRRAVCDESSDEATVAQAARQLARLAEAGVPGADPDQWWSTTEASTSMPLPAARNLSPSRIEGLLACPLREVVGKFEEESDTPLAMTRGTLAHAFFEALGRGVDPEVATELTVAAYRDILTEPEWRVGLEVESFAVMLAKLAGWVNAKTPAGVEIKIQVPVTEDVGISGRIDWLDFDDDGKVRIVDLKTGKSPVTAAEAEEHQQLAAYQLAVTRGVQRGNSIVGAQPGEETLEVARAVLLYPGAANKTAAVREQSPLEQEELDELAAQVPELASRMEGPKLLAQENSFCEHCALRSICPIQPEGKMVTHV